MSDTKRRLFRGIHVDPSDIQVVPDPDKPNVLHVRTSERFEQALSKRLAERLREQGFGPSERLTIDEDEEDHTALLAPDLGGEG